MLATYGLFQVVWKKPVLLQNATNESVSGTLDLDNDKVHSVLLCTAGSATVGSDNIQGMNLPFAWRQSKSSGVFSSPV